MIILEVESAIVRNLLERSLDINEKLSGEYLFCDFDGVRFRVGIQQPKTSKKDGGDEQKKGAGPTMITVEMLISCAKELNGFGAMEVFDRLYGEYKTEPGSKPGWGAFNYAIKFDLAAFAPEKRKEVITLAARLKANILGAPILWVAEQVAKKSNFRPFEIPYRAASGESLFVCPTEQGASATFRIRFSDQGDKIIAYVIFHELQVARNRVQGAPAITFSNEAPAHLSSFGQSAGDPTLYAYVTISLLTTQLSDRKKQASADYVPIFRNYLHYHIKCAKAFLHQKMRARTAQLLKILASATPEPKVKVRRTITGKIMGQ